MVRSGEDFALRDIIGKVILFFIIREKQSYRDH